MVYVRQGVYHWHGRVLGEFDNILVSKDARKNQVIKASQDTDSIAHALVHIELNVGGSQKEGVSAQQRHSGFRRDASAGTALLENYAHRPACQRTRQAFSVGFVRVQLFVVVRHIEEALQFGFAVKVAKLHNQE